MLKGLNVIGNRYIYQFMSTNKLTGSIRFDSQIQIHTGTYIDDVSLAKEFQDQLKNITANMVLLIKKNKNKGS